MVTQNRGENGKTHTAFASKETEKYGSVQTDSNIWNAFSSELPVKFL